MRRLLISALLLCSAPVSAQHLAPEDYIFPLRNVAGLYSANFGEMRPNHFHSGIDIKTDGMTGKPVLATADGYISRIAVTPGGYGRAIYITHPNGTTSVYGHLSKFRDDIEKYVHEERYRTRRNSINLYPSADRFPLKQGEQFAWSGNTGSSAGPHLHFEIRDSRTQRTLNTISSGVIRTRDDIPPRLVKLYYVEVDSVRGVPVHARPRPVELVEKTPGRYALKQEGALSVGGRGYFILEATDRKNDVSNTFGLWRIREFADEDPIFEHSYRRLRLRPDPLLQRRHPLPHAGRLAQRSDPPHPTRRLHRRFLPRLEKPGPADSFGRPEPADPHRSRRRQRQPLDTRIPDDPTACTAGFSRRMRFDGSHRR
ncbi:MAG: M23 family metallopeptidase [Alistipes putredinis]